jgi:HPt (histidine-containing phosphotransfer) domain-containing protein
VPFPATANKGHSPVQPVDLARLAEQTGGDRKLEREVLTLFLDDASVQVERLGSASAADRRASAHRLLGSARAIGAGEVARLAAAVETGQGDVDALAAAIDVARQYIVAYLAKPE